MKFWERVLNAFEPKTRLCHPLSRIIFNYNEQIEWRTNSSNKQTNPDPENSIRKVNITNCLLHKRTDLRYSWEEWAWAFCSPSVPRQARAPVPNPPTPSFFHPLLRSPSFPTLLWCVVTRSAGSSSMTDCYFLERKRIWLLTSGPLQLQTRALYINQEVISKQRDHPPINLLGSGGITCSCNPG